jgi:hypothetical protein
MALTTSGLYVANMIDVFDATQLAIDLSLTSHKVALLSASASANFSTDVSWSNTNEVSGTNWATGGIALSAIASGGTSAAPTNTESPTGTQMYDAADFVVANTTLSSFVAYRLYADALASDNLIVLVYFGGTAYSTNAGTLTIQHAATGIFTIDWTP